MAEGDTPTVARRRGRLAFRGTRDRAALPSFRDTSSAGASVAEIRNVPSDCDATVTSNASSGPLAAGGRATLCRETRIGDGMNQDREAIAKQRARANAVWHEAADDKDIILMRQQRTAREHGNHNRPPRAHRQPMSPPTHGRGEKTVESPQMENMNAPAWRKSSRCGTSTCVEVAKIDDTYLVRDSKNPEAAALSFTKAEWDAFVEGVSAGEFRF
ncbi:hypothetical protein Acy02nite_63810 [Actinoplanes cyaneus]|uniref:DUF397 domain-containing protein n=2 Tax=Actinoplanes cyaneus TaxID=52696 RepID=A0A919IUY0_9ACTN|nr:hypothetical protein Acy02nite_63810 [Actinoplanes cyaneus]